MMDIKGWGWKEGTYQPITLEAIKLARESSDQDPEHERLERQAQRYDTDFDPADIQASGRHIDDSEYQAFKSPFVAGSKGADWPSNLSFGAIFAAGAFTASAIWFVILLATGALP